MTTPLAIVGTSLGLLDQITAGLQSRGIPVTRSRHPVAGQSSECIVLGAALRWRRTWWSNRLSRWKLDQAISKIETSISQDGTVLVLVQLIGVPARRLESTLDHLATIAENATARVTNLQGADATINILAFEGTSQRPLVLQGVLDFMETDGRFATGECVYAGELTERSLQDALNSHAL